MRKYYLAVIIIFVVAGAAIGVSVLQRQGPAHDELITDDFYTISRAIDTHADKNKQLPQSLSELGLESKVAKRAGDYSYRPGSDGKYELCANFRTDTTKSGRSGYEGDPDFHLSGFHCIKFDTYF